MWKKSKVWKNKYFLAAAAMEVLLALVGIVGVCRGSSTAADLSTARILLNDEAVTKDGQGIYIDRESDCKGRVLELSGFTLTPGVYRLELFCDSVDNDVNTLGIECRGQAFRALLSNDVPIYAGKSDCVCEFYVLRKIGEADGLSAYVEYNGSGGLFVENLQIVKTTGGSRIFLFWVLTASFLIDTLMMLSCYRKQYPVEKERLLVWFGIPALTVLASLPVFTDYAILGVDAIYHWGRIEALAEGIRDGVFPVRVGARWLYGHGYASSLFYGDTFLIIPALFRLIGFPMTTAYNMFLFVVNLATALIAYVSFCGIFGDRRIGMLGSMLFTLAPYRIYNIYNRSAVGEFLAMTFLPLLCFGFYRIFAKDPQEKGYRSSWVILVLGFSGIIQSHLLSCEMVGGFSVLLCLILIKKVFRRQTFWELLKVVAGTVLANLWFLLPCLDMMVSGEYNYSHNANVYIQNRGVLWANMLDTMQAAGANSKFYEYGLQDAEPIGIGIAAMIGVAAFWFLRNANSENPKTQKRDRAAVVAVVLGAAGLLLSSAYFPWDFIKGRAGAFGGLVSMLQFPTRLTIIPVICAVFVCCVSGELALQEKDKTVSYGFFMGICAACLMFSLYQTNDTLMSREEYLRIYSPASIGNSGILGAEYLPLGVDYPSGYHGAAASEGVEILSFAKKGLDTVTEVATDSADGEYYVDLPMLYYKGYQAKEKEVLRVTSAEDGHVRAVLPAGYEGVLHVGYEGMWYWRLAEVISALAGVGIVVYLSLTFSGKFTTI